MSDSSEPVRFAPRLAVRHVQIARALLAAIAALMVTFSSDHSASVGLSVFSGFAVTTALILGFAAWMTYPAGRKWPAATLAVVTAIAGMVAGVPIWRTTPLFFILVISWALAVGAIEFTAGWRERAAMKRENLLDPQRRSEARDAMTVGALGLLLAVGLAVVPAGYRLDYFIADADEWFTLTGITIAVGIFGAYAAIVAVYLAIAGFSPRREAAPLETTPEATTDATPTGGAS